MFKEFFLLLLLGHVIGDFYIQTGSMARKKDKSFKWVLIHCLCYLCVMLFISLPMLSWKFTLGSIVAAGLHLLIDGCKFAYITYQFKKYGINQQTVSPSSVNATLHAAEVKNDKISQIVERNIFFVDLILHGISIIMVAYWLVVSNTIINEWKLCRDFFSVIGVTESSVVTWILALLLIHKPANIAIQKLLIIYKPVNKDKKIDNNAGRFIGTLERIIMLIFLSIGQYSAIGLVLTAKSIARYDKISKERDFAEYYLLGTLISTVVVIVCSFLFI